MFNSWDLSITPANSDFLSVSDPSVSGTGMSIESSGALGRARRTAPCRRSTSWKLAAASKMIEKGTDVGLRSWARRRTWLRTEYGAATTTGAGGATGGGGSTGAGGSTAAGSRRSRGTSGGGTVGTEARTDGNGGRRRHASGAAGSTAAPATPRRERFRALRLLDRPDRRRLFDPVLAAFVALSSASLGRGVDARKRSEVSARLRLRIGIGFGTAEPRLSARRNREEEDGAAPHDATPPRCAAVRLDDFPRATGSPSPRRDGRPSRLPEAVEHVRQPVGRDARPVSATQNSTSHVP